MRPIYGPGSPRAALEVWSKSTRLNHAEVRRVISRRLPRAVSFGHRNQTSADGNAYGESSMACSLCTARLRDSFSAPVQCLVSEGAMVEAEKVRCGRDDSAGEQT